jgi:hypothetical protein
LNIKQAEEDRDFGQVVTNLEELNTGPVSKVDAMGSFQKYNGFVEEHTRKQMLTKFGKKGGQRWLNDEERDKNTKRMMFFSCMNKI